MNILQYIDILSGGKNSGDYGHSGRPGEKGGSGAGTPKGNFSPEQLKSIHQVLKDTAFKQARKALSKVVVKQTGGKITNKQKAEMIQKGALLFPTKGYELLDTIEQKVKKGQTKTKYEEIVHKDLVHEGLFGKNKFNADDYAKQTKSVTVTVIKPVKAGRPVAMGKNESVGRKSPGILPHPMAGKFSTSMDRIDEGSRKTWVFDADKTPEGHGNTLFIEHNRISPTKAEVRIQEVKRVLHNQIEETKEIHFDSSKNAKDYLHRRYSIKNFSWSGAKEKGWHASSMDLLALMTGKQRMDLMRRILQQYNQPFTVISVKSTGGYKSVKARLKSGKTILVRV